MLAALIYQLEILKRRTAYYSLIQPRNIQPSHGNDDKLGPAYHSAQRLAIIH